METAPKPLELSQANSKNLVYKLAFTGIKQQCLDRKLNSVLHSNRAAAQRHIGNLRSAIKDCAAARKFDPTNLKVSLTCYQMN